MAANIRVICPLSACSSYEKRDQFLALLKGIAAVTKESEPKTTSYAWFTSTGDNTEVPNNWVRGFEVYEDESALVEVHRSSTPYKKMRSSVVPEKILEKPTDLRFLRPTGYGFMTRRSSSCNFDGKILQNDEKSLVKIMEIKPLEKTRAEMLTEIQMLAGHVEQFEATTASFWVLEYLPEYSEDTVVIFSRFKNTMACQAHQDSNFVSNSMGRVSRLAATVRTTRWFESGIGFIGR